MVIIRYFLSDTYIAKSQLSSVNCQPKATHPREKTPPIYPPTNYQLPGSKLPVSRQRATSFSAGNSQRLCHELPPPCRPIINILYKMATNLCTPESSTDKAQINRKRKGARLTIDRPSHYD